ncbi:hypothetical protein [Leuconostoc gasicomitatum]|uniref:hypothetical protein n=1 Tax=Leuconostoc gasicomitatum TaxID=115778 RepID=UPI0007DF193E|nr:hypothetical protein [Leuconostoc gasicomitatum]CUW09627.1 hypothetical protein PB1E_1554 [Leuconostoc gasicomitatum]
MDKLLNKNDQIKLNIANYLFESQYESHDINQVSKKMLISRYMLVESLKSLQYDFDTLFHIKVLKVLNGRIYVNRHTITRAQMYRLSHFYFVTSPYKLLLEYRILNGDTPRYNKIATDYGWSSSLYFKYKRHLSSIIGAKNSYMFIHNAFFISSHYQFTFNFPLSIQTLSQKIWDQLLAYEIVKSYDYTQLFNFLCLIVIELNNNHDIFMQSLNNEKTYLHITGEINDIIDEILNVTSHGKIMSFILQLFHAFDFINENILRLSFPSNNHTNAILLSRTKNFLSSLPILLTPSEESSLIQNINLEIVKHIHNHMQMFNTNSSIDLSYFREVYPTLYHATQKFIVSVISALKTKDQNIGTLVFKIITRIFEVTNTDNIDPVTISINFSGSFLTDNMVLLLLKNHINHANVYFTNKTTLNDILITDAITGSNNNGIIWKKPPTPKDWEVLGELIVTTKKNKYLETNYNV